MSQWSVPRASGVSREPVERRMSQPAITSRRWCATAGGRNCGTASADRRTAPPPGSDQASTRRFAGSPCGPRAGHRPRCARGSGRVATSCARMPRSGSPLTRERQEHRPVTVLRRSRCFGPSGVAHRRLRLLPRLKTPCRSRARRPARPLWTGRCPWVASCEGSEAFPVVSTGSWADLRPERGSWPGHVAVLGFDHGPGPLEGRRREGRVQLAGLSGGPGQIPGVCGQLGQVHVHQGGSRVLLTPRHCVPQRQAGIVAPCLCRLFCGAA
jgi:hypothetical protein